MPTVPPPPPPTQQTLTCYKGEINFYGKTQPFLDGTLFSLSFKILLLLLFVRV